MKKNKLIAITGGIGSGKSCVLSILNKAGYNTLSCDEITSQLYQKRKTKLLLKKLFPSAVKGFFNPKINRQEISRIVFSDKQQLALLTNAITPLVLEEVKRQAKSLDGLVFVEVPLLFECNYQDQFDEIMVVKRSLKDRIESTKKRSNLTEEQIFDRINNQVDYESLDLNKYIIIDNHGNIEGLTDKVLSIARQIEK